ncbi:MAG: (d)CMP kinase [Corynebacterium sp.]|nr:(d)CMP kinase [Corynebacterium sp.]
MNLTTITNTPTGLLVAVDGPSGAGKSTLCREVAIMANAKYVDTGAMYRLATLHALNEGIDVHDAAAVAQATAILPLELNDDPRSHAVLLAGVDVQDEIRGERVTRNVSAVAAIPAVRENLVALQRELAMKAQRCIFDGRDIGTTVFPDAPLKVYLTASAEVRAQRRLEQNLAAGRLSDYASVLADVQRRDALDANREVSPLRPADDAIIVDTSDMGQQAAIRTLCDLVVASAERK